MNIIIEKPPTDTRNYQYLRLKNNLEVIIIHDKTETLCGAFLNVNIGSAKEKIPGLAHFLEHMLFMGSKKYPNSNNFLSSISKSGGTTNASTSNTDTNYYFICSTDTYLDNLDKFGNFLVDPLLSKEYINKEIENVNSESNKNIVDNDWLSLEIIKTLINPKHPVNHYTAGTTHSLSIPNIYEELKNFKNENYTADRMSLVLFINDEINLNKSNNRRLNEILDQTLSIIPTKNKKEKLLYGELLTGNQIVFYQSFKDEPILNVCIQVKTSKKLIDSPLPFIYYLLNLQYQDSLFDKLTLQKLITKLECSELDEYDDYTIFIISCDLTDKGYAKYNDVYNYIRSYFDFICEQIKSRNSLIEKHFNQYIQTNKNNFNFFEKPDINDIINHIAMIMKYDVPREYLLSYNLKLNFNSYVENFNLIFDEYLISVSIGNSEFKYKGYKTFPNYKVPYIVKNVEWEKKEITYIPILNDFICYNLKFNEIQQSVFPVRLNTSFISYYYSDSKYLTPYVETKIFIRIPQLLDSIDNYVSALLYFSSVQNSLLKMIDLMGNGGYIFYIKLNLDSIYITIGGYTEKIFKSIKIIKKIFAGKLDDDAYEQAKFKLIQEYKNFSYDTIMYKFGVISNKYINKKYFMPKEILGKLKITINECENTYKSRINSGRISIFTFGNVDKDFADKLNRKVYKYISTNIKHVESPYNYNIIKKYKKPEIFIDKFSTPDINKLISLLYPLPPFKINDTENWIDLVIFARLFEVILGNSFYYELRTEKQLGYIVKISSSIYENNDCHQIYIKFFVQSSKYDDKYVLSQINLFIKKYTKIILHEMSLIDFKQYLEGEKNKLLRDFDTISDLGSYFMASILDESYVFNTRELILNRILTYDLDNFRNYFENYFVNNNEYLTLIIK